MSDLLADADTWRQYAVWDSAETTEALAVARLLLARLEGLEPPTIGIRMMNSTQATIFHVSSVSRIRPAD
ncbi:MAG: hypothetical protein ABFS21_12810 [Actinomycetota bacterium]